MADPTPAEQSAASSALLARIMAGQAPQARGVGAPPDQKYVAWFDDQNQLHFDENMNYKADAPKTTVYGDQNSGYFTVDANGGANVVMNPNPDAMVTKAVERQDAEAQRNERAANAAAGKGYMTDQERLKIEQEGTRLGQNQATIDENKRQFDIKQKSQDAVDAVNKSRVDQEIVQSQAQTQLIGAQTQRTGAETGQIGAQTDVLKQKAGPEIGEIEARTALAKQQAEDLKRKAGQPTVVSLGEGSTYATQGPNGQITEQIRQGYVPKTLAEVQARVGQIQQAANAKMSELQAKIGANYSADQADQDFKTWYQQNVVPQGNALQAAQEQAMFDRAQDQAKTQTAAYTAANAAGQLAVSAYNAQAPRRLGEGAQGMINSSLNAINQAAGRPNVDYSALVTRQPDLQQQSQQAVNQALAAISPAAAAASGAPPPNFAGANIQGALDASQWMPSARRPMQAAPAGGGAITAAPQPNPALGQGPNVFPGLAQGRGQGGMPLYPQPGQPGVMPFTGLAQGQGQGGMPFYPPPYQFPS